MFMNRIFLAGLLGGITMFILEHIAYTELPASLTGIRKLPNERVVLEALQKNVAENPASIFFLRGGSRIPRTRITNPRTTLPEKWPAILRAF